MSAVANLRLFRAANSRPVPLALIRRWHELLPIAVRRQPS